MIGESITIAGIRGNIKGGYGAQFFWGSSEGANDAPFDKIGLTTTQKYDFCEKVLGYRPATGDFPYCKSIEDIKAIAIAIEAAFRPTSTSEFTFTKADGSGLRGNIKVDSDGDWYWNNPSGSNGACFSIIAPSINEEEFQDRLLGYRRGGSFPYCKSKEDVLKICTALEARNLEQIRQKKAEISSPEIPDSFEFTTSDGSLMKGEISKSHSGEGWYWHNPRSSNSECFDIIREPKEDFQQRVLGYKGDGVFPYCKSKADLYRFCLAIERDRKLILAMKFGPIVTKISVMPEEAVQQAPLNYKVPPPVMVKVPKI